MRDAGRRADLRAAAAALAFGWLRAASGAADSPPIGPVLPPPSVQLSAINPASGASTGGARVALTGYLFSPGASVQIGPVQATGLAFPSGSRIDATAPPLPPGSVHDVVVTNPDASSATLPAGWFSNFLDVSAANPFHDAIERITRRGITSGCGGGNFCPGSPVTRAQMAVFLLRASHGPAYVPPPATGAVFGDVPAGAFAADWIERLAAEGITGGCGGGNFCPTVSVTRGQMAVFLLASEHGTGYAPPPATGIFADVPIAAPFASWIEQLSREGITSGCGGANYCPNDPSTRAQMAVFLSTTFDADLLRFLQQSTWGASDALISHARKLGIHGYLDEQFSLPASGYPALPLQPDTVPPSCDTTCQRDNYSMYPLQTRFFTNAIYSPDQLRQRVAFALHSMIVVSGRDVNQPGWMTPYLRILDRNAFGNFRQLLYEITLNPAMGKYLDMASSTRNNPNENYAREILQLFSIGVNLLHPDGRPQLDANGVPIPSYDQAIVTGFSKVFTGWKLQPEVSPDVPDYITPMRLIVNQHDTGPKTLLSGMTLPAGRTGDQDLNDALDNIFFHPNVGPYVSAQLIHSLVKSNPSPAYVFRVARVFDDDGAGVRGNLKAVVEAILLDPEARDSRPDPNGGHLKEPVLFVTNLLRAHNARSADGRSTSDGHLNPQTRNMDQDVLRPPSVFSYFPADFLTPGTTDLLGPEFAILSASTALRRANFVNTMVYGSIGVGMNFPRGTSLDLARLQPLAANPQSLVTELSRLMMQGSMSPAMQTRIAGAVAAISAAQPLQRVRQAVYLVATSPQYQVQR